MTNQRLLLVESREGGKLSVAGDASSVTELELASDLEATSQRVANFAKQHQIASPYVVLAIRSENVFSVSLSLKSARKPHDREMLLYRLEASLPFAVEETVADFVVSDHECLGVGICADDYQPIVDSLEQAGIRVKAIVPTALAITQQWCATSETPDFLLLRQEEGEDLLQFSRGKPTNWWFRRTDQAGEFDEFATAIANATLERAGQVRVAYSGNTPPWPPHILKHVDLLPLASVDTDSLVSAAAQRIGAGHMTPWIDLHRAQLRIGDPLREIQAPLRLFAISLLVFIVALGAGYLWRAQRLEGRMAELHDLQKISFAAALPDRRVPSGGIIARLTSEVRAMRGSREKEGDAKLAPSAIFILQELLRGLPESTAFTLEQATIENGSIDIDLRAASFADINLMIGSLQARGFGMSPPSGTQVNPDTVSTRLLGKYVEDAREPPSPGGSP